MLKKYDKQVLYFSGITEGATVTNKGISNLGFVKPGSKTFLFPEAMYAFSPPGQTAKVKAIKKGQEVKLKCEVTATPVVEMISLINCSFYENL
jgi:hypothetical protein